ncbi:MFS transporter [Exilibacterium tricleocarpae]|uniref:MFS transporter n=1 Tax=Exilibacterium tricleocarpae TaxID=2591008 RepID=A0A545TNG1_9GAMM|nr:MFS transporter [Exilibacterium tricleocarpae]TQV78754.1 MFS transporter [Exilibacterium tricleocarpae]
MANINHTADQSIPTRAGTREWLGLVLLALPTLLLGLDLTFLPLILPSLAEHLQPTSTQALWIMDISGFMLGGFLITMGTLGDRIGRRRLLMIGMIAFASASTVAAFSTSAVMLIAARALVGIAAATLMPSTLSLISELFRNPQERAMAFGLWATVFGVGYALGPVGGGYLMEQFWWGAAFLVAIPLTLVLLVFARTLLPEHWTSKRDKIDLLSVAFSLIAMLSATHGIKQLAKFGISFEGAIALTIGLIVAAVFIRRQYRLADPLLDIKLFSNHEFTAALIVLLVGLIAVGGTMMLTAQYLQLVCGYAPFAAGLWMGVAALGMIAGGIGAPVAARYIRPGFVVAGSLVLSALGYAMLAIAGQVDFTIALIVSGLALAYLGNGAIAALGTDLVVGSAPSEKAGSASAMSEAVQDIGVSMGIALLGSVATAIYRSTMLGKMPDTLSADTRDATSDSLWAATAIASELPADLMKDAQSAFILGFNSAAIFSAVSVMILAILAALALRHVRTPGAYG